MALVHSCKNVVVLPRTPPPPQQNKIKSFQELHKNNPEWDKTASQQKKFNKLYRTKRSLKKATFQSQLLAQIH